MFSSLIPRCTARGNSKRARPHTSTSQSAEEGSKGLILSSRHRIGFATKGTKTDFANPDSRRKPALSFGTASSSVRKRGFTCYTFAIRRYWFFTKYLLRISSVAPTSHTENFPPKRDRKLHHDIPTTRNRCRTNWMSSSQDSTTVSQQAESSITK